VGASTGAAAFGVPRMAAGEGASAYRAASAAPGSRRTAVDACFRLRSRPSGPRRLRVKGGRRLLSRSAGCAAAAKREYRSVGFSPGQWGETTGGSLRGRPEGWVQTVAAVVNERGGSVRVGVGSGAASFRLELE
jgi:hypothetical protein